MSALERLACMQHRRDEIPNQELAKDLVRRKDKAGIREVAENLWNSDRNIQNDCIKVLYEIGYLDPRLIAQFSGDFLKLLESKNNRMAWGGMLALSTVANLRANQLFKQYRVIEQAVETGSVITQDNGIATLATIASKSRGYRKKIFPFLLKHLETCRPKDIPQHSEKSLIAVDAYNRKSFIKVLEKRSGLLSPSQLKRVTRVIREVNQHA
jgi:hypothetical protein